MRLFTGWDAREAVGWHVFAQSLFETSPGVGITPLSGTQGDGSNAFTYSRFEIPELCHWSEWAMFVDGADMLLKADIRELWGLRESRYAVQVVKHEYQTKHPVKYVATEMESANADYPRKNWSSVMLINCGHIAHFTHRKAIRNAIEKTDGVFLHRFAWLKDAEIGELPVEWNWLADEYGANTQAKLLHWTAGIPGFYHYHRAPHADEWRKAARNLLRGMQ